ncbi:hypothetical protein M231_02717 [Tremella mesenterica]|uniref:Uncharacterized protein n=1 Tax=Tremella mesenterica TaxID=5217 RepID=A0A4V1M4E4_TREME|nr:hypothetical protein M231_02717 [Tremella mesenterica]
MESLSPECSPFKQRYDSCFNLWFEGYLQPALDSSNISRISSTPSPSSSSSPHIPALSTAALSSATGSSVSDRVRPVTNWSSAFNRRNVQSKPLAQEHLQGGHVPPYAHSPYTPTIPVTTIDTTGKTRAQVKAEEYEMACGQAWREYQSCLKVAIKQNASLSTLLDQAREEHPLHDLVGLRGTAWDPQTPITPVE